MEITFKRSEMANFIQFCKTNQASKIDFFNDHIIIYFSNGTAKFDIKLDIRHPFTINSNEYFVPVFCKELLKNEELKVSVPGASIKFSGYDFKITDISEEQSDESDNIARNVTVASFTKDSLKDNFKNDFAIVKSNCFKKIEMMGCGLSASAGVFTKTAPGTILYKIGEVKADLESKTFASHDSPINFSRAACIFTEKMYSTIMGLDFSRAEMSIPIETNDTSMKSNMVFVIDNTTTITFENVYVQKSKAEANYKKIVAAPANKHVVLTKSAITEIVETYAPCCNSNDDDSIIEIDFNDGSVVPVVDSIRQKAIENKKSDDVKINFDIAVLEYLNSNADFTDGSIDIDIKSSNAFTGDDSKEEFCCISGNNGSAYIFKNSVSEEND